MHRSGDLRQVKPECRLQPLSSIISLFVNLPNTVILAIMHIQQQDDGKNGAFFIQEGTEQVALMTYTWTAPNLLTIVHTEVNEDLEGKGVGRHLVHRAVEFARLKNSRSFPQCPFAKAIIDKTPEFQDVLK